MLRWIESLIHWTVSRSVPGLCHHTHYLSVEVGHYVHVCCVGPQVPAAENKQTDKLHMDRAERYMLTALRINYNYNQGI